MKPLDRSTALMGESPAGASSAPVALFFVTGSQRSTSFFSLREATLQLSKADWQQHPGCHYQRRGLHQATLKAVQRDVYTILCDALVVRPVGDVVNRPG